VISQRDGQLRHAVSCVSEMGIVSSSSQAREECQVLVTVQKTTEDEVLWESMESFESRRYIQCESQQEPLSHGGQPSDACVPNGTSNQSYRIKHGMWDLHSPMPILTSRLGHSHGGTMIQAQRNGSFSLHHAESTLRRGRRTKYRKGRRFKIGREPIPI
jgi:hypothetical protein